MSVRTARGGTGWLWLLGGALLALGVVSLPSIGLFVLTAAVAVLVGAVVWGGRGWPWLFLGSAAVLLWVAWRHRRGPGTVCSETATGGGCTEYLDPWWFATPGLVALVLGASPLLLRRRRGARESAPSA